MVPQVHTKLLHPLSGSCNSKIKAYDAKSIMINNWDIISNVSANNED